jgi:hypothetical protein
MFFIKSVKVTLLVKNEDDRVDIKRTIGKITVIQVLRLILNMVLKIALPHRLHKLTIGKCIVINSFFVQLHHKNTFFVD